MALGSNDSCYIIWIMNRLITFSKRFYYNNPSTVSNKSRLQPLLCPPKLSLQKLASQMKLQQTKVRKTPILNLRKLTNNQIDIVALLNDRRAYIGDVMPKKAKRPPVVTIMGHVDHGKTSILDHFRKSSIALNQAGGITQKITAFNVNSQHGTITFIDTPGHHTFKNMRIRGASATDIVILVVSAVQGPQAQTKQVINVIKQLNLPVIVALNKIDVEGVNVQEVQKSLIQTCDLGLDTIQGGNIPVIHISAKTGKNMDLLLQLIYQQAKNYKLSEIREGLSDGLVVQARRNLQDLKSFSAVVLKGTIKPGHLVIAGNDFFRVKKIINQNNAEIKQGTPSMAVEIEGAKTLPDAGDLFYAVDSQSKAQLICEFNSRIKKISKQVQNMPQAPKIKISNWRQRKSLRRGVKQTWQLKYKEVEEEICSQLEAAKKAKDSAKVEILQKKLSEHLIFLQQFIRDFKKDSVLNLVVKAKDKGTLQVLLAEISSLELKAANLGIKIKVLTSEVGQIMQNDIEEARQFQAVIIGMDLNINQEIGENIKQLSIRFINIKVIYNLAEELTKEIILKKNKGFVQVDKGEAEIVNVYTVSFGGKKKTKAAGLKITEGRLLKRMHFQVLRNGKVLKGGLQNGLMKVFKEQVGEVRKGQQCTIIFPDFQQFEKGDVIKCYELVKV